MEIIIYNLIGEEFTFFVIPLSSPYAKRRPFYSRKLNDETHVGCSESTYVSLSLSIHVLCFVYGRAECLCGTDAIEMHCLYICAHARYEHLEYYSVYSLLSKIISQNIIIISVLFS